MFPGLLLVQVFTNYAFHAHVSLFRLQIIQGADVLKEIHKTRFHSAK